MRLRFTLALILCAIILPAELYKQHFWLSIARLRMGWRWSLSARRYTKFTIFDQEISISQFCDSFASPF
jgi:hypothetical protein